MGEQRFKVGDWVRVKDNRGAPRDYKVGEVRQVTKIDDDIVRCGSAGMFDYRFEPWQPRVGERVRVSSAKLSHKSVLIGREFKVTHQAYVLDDGAQTWGGDNAGGYVWRADELEPILATAAPEQPATLKIEAGKFYKTRDGRKVGPMRDTGGSSDHWTTPKTEIGLPYWHDDGAHWSGRTNPTDLIAEWIDETAAKTKASNDNAQPKFKVGDVVKRFKGNNPGSEVGHEATISKIEDISGWDDNGPWLLFEDGTSGYATSFRFATTTTPTPTTTIVALIENGQPKPSSTPHVHTSTGAAEKEAKRLAAKFKGQQFGVFTLTTTHEEAAPVYDHKWQNLAVLGLKIDAIKELRSITGMGLKPAKDAVEYFLDAA